MREIKQKRHELGREKMSAKNSNNNHNNKSQSTRPRIREREREMQWSQSAVAVVTRRQTKIKIKIFKYKFKWKCTRLSSTFVFIISGLSVEVDAVATTVICWPLFFGRRKSSNTSAWCVPCAIVHLVHLFLSARRW